MQQYILHCIQEKHRLIIQLLLLIVFILSRENSTRVYRSCRRLPRSTGWRDILFLLGGTRFSLSDKELSSEPEVSSLCDAMFR